MGRKSKIQIGDRFGLLVVIERTQSHVRPYVLWKCKCDCGKESYFRTNNLVTGHSTSCGCFRSRVSSVKNLMLNGHVEKTNVLSMEKQTVYKNNSTGVRGVQRSGRYFRATIFFNGQTRRLGTFKSIEEAAEARKNAEDEIQDELKRLRTIYDSRRVNHGKNTDDR